MLDSENFVVMNKKILVWMFCLLYKISFCVQNRQVTEVFCLCTLY